MVGAFRPGGAARPGPGNYFQELNSQWCFCTAALAVLSQFAPVVGTPPPLAFASCNGSPTPVSPAPVVPDSSRGRAYPGYTGLYVPCEAQGTLVSGVNKPMKVVVGIKASKPQSPNKQTKREKTFSFSGATSLLNSSLSHHLPRPQPFPHPNQCVGWTLSHTS